MATDIKGIINYVELLVAGGGPASTTGEPLGPKFYIKTAGKCKDEATGSIVPRYIYVNNVPSGNIPLISSGLGVNFSEFRGLIPGILEDIGALRSIPNLNIICPADSLETIKAVNAMIKSKQPSYLRLTGSANNFIVNKNDYDFEIGKSVTLKDGSDVVIFSHGCVVSECLKAADLLMKKNISCKVVNMHTIKPLDKEAVIESKKFKLIVSVEEHNIIGGLGSAISECLANEKNKPQQLFLGIKDYYEKGGSYSYLLDRYGLSSKKIVESIILKFKNE